MPHQEALSLVELPHLEHASARSASRLGQREYPDDELVPSLFHEPWWLDAVAAGSWHAAEVTERGRRVAWMPYVLQRRKGFRVSVLPPLTHVLGPAFAPELEGRRHGRRRVELQAELAARLPRVAHFSQACHPGVVNLLGFQAQGFETFAQCSAEMLPAPEAVVWSSLGDKTRNVIRRARDSGRVELLDDPLAFVRFYTANVALGGEPNYTDLACFPALWAAVQRRGCGMIAAHRDSSGRLTAAAFFVWDNQRCWYVLSTRDPSRAGNGATSLLVWRGLQEASRRGLVFDFHGIASAGAARFYAGFGARFTARLALHQRNAVYALLKCAADGLRGSRRNCFVPP